MAGKLQRSGVVERGWLGVQLRDPTQQESRSLGLERGTGVIIVKAIEGGPGLTSGLAAGDAIVSLNGGAVRDPASFARAIIGQAPNTEVTLGAIQKTGRADM